MATANLEFEKPLFEIERQIDELRRLATEQELDVGADLAPLESKLGKLRAEIYRNLSPLQRVQVARSNKRPLLDDYIRLVFTDFIELHGDRAFRDDAAIIGEGGSGGALALGVADRVLMLENSVYSVITVEGCAAILWKDGKSPEMREKAASALRITAPDLLELKVIDEVIREPLGGAHSNHEEAAAALKDALERHLEELRRLKPDKLVRRRREKFLKMGQFTE